MILAFLLQPSYKDCSSADMPRPLPTFSKPPIVEVIVGLQFDPLLGFRAVHLGGFWSSLEGEWDALLDAPALGQTQEPAGSDVLWMPPGLQFEPTPEPNLRIRAQDKSRQHMLQLENGWLVLNWRRPSDAAQYPSFAQIKPKFDEQRRRLESFLASAGLGIVRPNLWELSYINMIPRGILWNEVHEWPRIFPRLLGGCDVLEGGSLQSVGGKWLLRLPEGRGRLQVILEHGKAWSPKEQEMLVLKLVARGTVRPDAPDSLDQGYDSGHRAIVQTFADLLSDEARRELGYRAGAGS